MHFCDEVTLKVLGGNGGGGSKSFRHEKFVAKGGPDGGDGGKGGSAILQVDTNRNTLAEYAPIHKILAEHGQHGGKQKMHGRNGENRIIKVPQGTIVTDLETGDILADLSQPNMQFEVARGGRGGYGNSHFTSSTRQAPSFAELGEPGEERDIKLELKLVSDVGVIGIPSVGKSSLIARVSAAKPKIADYPFTTLIPNLGVVAMSSFGGDRAQSFLMCDVPGLIEGASSGKGLGIQFLKHVSRNRTLLHIVDGSRDSISEDYTKIMHELAEFDPTLLEKKMIVAINKIDILDEELRELKLEELSKVVGDAPIHLISCGSGEGISELMWEIWKALEEAPREDDSVHGDDLGGAVVDEEEAFKIFRPHLEEDPRRFTIEVVGKHVAGAEASEDSDDDTAKDGSDADKKAKTQFRIHGKRIEQIVIMTDVTNEEAVYRVYDVLKKMHIHNELRKMGAKEGDEILISIHSFTFYNDV